MGQRHPSTPSQRAQGVAQMIAHAGEYGVVTNLSRQLGVSRQTLYTWETIGLAALEQAFTPAGSAGTPTHKEIFGRGRGFARAGGPRC